PRTAGDLIAPDASDGSGEAAPEPTTGTVETARDTPHAEGPPPPPPPPGQTGEVTPVFPAAADRAAACGHTGCVNDAAVACPVCGEGYCDYHLKVSPDPDDK